ncbi:hypothetical protein LINPERPRIM_LOCUS28432 [Linum perenne]
MRRQNPVVRHSGRRLQICLRFVVLQIRCQLRCPVGDVPAVRLRLRALEFRRCSFFLFEEGALPCALQSDHLRRRQEGNSISLRLYLMISVDSF